VLQNKEKRRRLLRKLLLRRLIKNILEGKVRTIPVPEGLLYNQLGGTRRQYYAPNERSSYNYGYMEIDEMGSGSPTIW
jgi:hypothetical protein